MELLPADAKTLRTMVTDEWFPHEKRELEATFGVNGVVDSTRFLAVAQRLKSKGLKEVRQPDRLTISLEDNTRYTIQDEGNIAQYCQDNTLTGKAAVAMIKDRAGDLHTLDLQEYDTRIKIRRELPLDMQDPRVKSHLATWDQRVKFFRLIQRYTFVGKGCIYDLSIVRSTKKDERGLWKQVTKFYDEDKHHNIMKELPVYEIEVELDRTSEDANTPQKALQAFVQGLGDVLRGIQRNPILIRNSIRASVLEGYRNLVGEDGSPTRRGFRGVQPVTLERENISPNLPSPGSTKPSIWYGYNVTDKADGLRVMGYCDSKGELYLLDMGLNIYRTGLKKEECKNTLVDGEWITQNKEGEAVQLFMLFDIYQGLNYQTTSSLPFYSESPDSLTRYKALLDWCTKWRGEGGPIFTVPGLTPKNSLKVMEKKFLFGEGKEFQPNKDIFTKCAQMLARTVSYKTDGLILTSNKAPIPSFFGFRFPQQFKWKPAKDNTIDFLVKFVKETSTNRDKLTDIIRPDNQDTLKYKTLRLFIGTSADPAYDDPRRTILLVKKLPSGRVGGKGKKKHRMRPVLFNPKQFSDSMASVCYLEAKEDVASQDWIVRCTSHDEEATGDPITDNSIVEMQYNPDPSIPAGWNWVPIRVRYDKTERFQSGTIEKTLNSIETAESVWKSIHEPITLHMITTGDQSPSQEEYAAALTTREQNTTISKRYYQKKSTIRNVSLVKSMASFHNIVIKGEILLSPILASTNVGLPAKKKVIDTSIGKGGDLNRYFNTEFLLGIDIDADGIRDPDDGAYRRFMDMLVQEHSVGNVPPMLFLIGDSSKSYVDGKSGINQEEADMMRSVFGKVPTLAKVPPYVEGKCKNQLKEGADLISSMFSIHYYFETKEKWEGFLHNIRDTLKVGGFFVCCCFDGNLIASLLSDKEMGESITGNDPVTNSTIWRVTKQNTLDENLPSTPSEGFGHGIDVEFLSIGSTHREYLVSYGLLIDEMSSIGCELATEEDCQKLGIPAASELFMETYEKDPDYKIRYPMSPDVLEFSFFNRWFVFRRYGTAPVAIPTSPDSPEEFAPKSPEEFAPKSPTSTASSWNTPIEGAKTPEFGKEEFRAFRAAPPYTPRSNEDESEVVAPFLTIDPERDFGEQQREYNEKKAIIIARGREREEARLPADISPEKREERLVAAGEQALAAAMYRYRYKGDRKINVEEEEQAPYSPTLSDYVAAGAITEENAAAIRARPKSTAWNEVPLSGSAATNAALRNVGAAAAAASSSKFKNESLVTSVVEGGTRTLPVERGTAAGPQAKYKSSDIFRFFGRAELKDSLGIGDAGAARWLALSAPFPIKDGAVEYPTVNHYLAGMKYKLATDKPELADDLFSSKGIIHTKYLRLREQIATKHKGEKEKRQVKEHEDQELLRQEAADVADASLPKTIKRYKAVFDEAKWIAEKESVLREALTQRWKYDARFHRIIEAAREKRKYLLYYTGSSTITSFGGILRDDGHIEGENQVGKILMQLAGYSPV